MAAKKTPKKSTETPPAEASSAPAPVAKKAAKKAAAPKPAAKKAAKSPDPKAAAKPTSDAIARAAYLNYRKRVEQGLPGDSNEDWLEAERQLGIVRSS